MAQGSRILHGVRTGDEREGSPIIQGDQNMRPKPGWNRRRFLGTAFLTPAMYGRSFTTGASPEEPARKPTLVIDNHGHVGALKPEDLLEGYNPQLDRSIFEITNSKLGLSARELIEAMDATGVDMAVLHTLRVWANKYQARVLREFPDRFIAVCKLDEQKAYTSEQIDKLHHYVGDWGFRGLYYDPPPGSDGHDNLATSKYEPLWKAVTSLNIPVSFVTYTGSPSIGYETNFESLWPILLRLLKKFPDLPVMIVHGIPPQPCLQPDNSVKIPETAIRLVKEHNVILGVLPAHLNYGPNDEVLKSFYDNFGPRRLAWGSEFVKTGLRSPAEYSRRFHYLQNNCPYMSQEDLRLILGGNVQRIYRLEC